MSDVLRGLFHWILHENIGREELISLLEIEETEVQRNRPTRGFIVSKWQLFW